MDHDSAEHSQEQQQPQPDMSELPDSDSSGFLNDYNDERELTATAAETLTLEQQHPHAKQKNDWNNKKITTTTTTTTITITTTTPTTPRRDKNSRTPISTEDEEEELYDEELGDHNYHHDCPLDEDNEEEPSDVEYPKKEQQEQQLPWPFEKTSRNDKAGTTTTTRTTMLLSLIQRAYWSLSFAYMNPILIKGKNQFKDNQQHLTLEDLYQAPQNLKANALVQQFWSTFDRQKGHLKWTLWYMAAPHFVPAGIWELIYVICRVAMPLSLREMLLVLEAHPNQNVAQFGGLKYAITMTVAATLGAIAQNRMNYLSTKSGIVLRACLTSAIYEHTLRLSPSERACLSQGEITNLVATDTQKLFDVMLELHNLWSCPLLILVVTALLWINVGPQLCIGVAILIAFLPLVKISVGRMLYLRKERSKLTDVRVNVLASMLQGIRVTKLNHYESKVEGAVRKIRNKEITLLGKELAMWGWILFAAIISPLIATTVAFMAYALQDPTNNLITPSKAFSSLLFLSILRFPINMTSRLVGKMGSADEGLRRIALFLSRPVSAPQEKEQPPLPPDKQQSSSSSQVVRIFPTAADDSTEQQQQQREMPPPPLPSGDDQDSDDDNGDRGPPLLQLRHGNFTFKPKEGCFFSPPPKNENNNNNDATAPSASNHSMHRRPRGSSYDNLMQLSCSAHSRQTVGDSSGLAAVTTTFALQDIDLSLRPGELCMVVGKVGSGKTLLLNALLGELPASTTTQTQLEVQGTLSYAPQIPFILNQSLRDNVLFGSNYHDEQYRRVIDACCLREDLELLGPARDLTQIGERGVTLSGGQKARVGLARACYAVLVQQQQQQPQTSNGAIVLLDDPFSALDSSTARNVFEGLFDPKSGVLREAGTILVTHAVHLLPRSSRILVLHEGTCSFSGTWDDLKEAQGGEAAAQNMDLRGVHFNLAAFEGFGGDGDGAAFDDDDDDEDFGRKKKRKKSKASKTQQQGGDAKDGIIMTVEERAYGISSIKVWLTWFQNAGGWTFFISQVIFLILDRGLYVASDWWLARWSDSVYTGFEMFGRSFEPQVSGREAQVAFVRVYGILVILSVLATAIRTQWSFKGGARCAKIMFYDMMHSVLRAPMLYFETTPLGRILNRFTYDVEVLDVELSVSMTGLMMSGSWLIASIVVMVVVLPWMLMGIVPVACAYFFIQQFYRMSGPDLQRLDAVSRSPLQAGLAEGMEGTISIRAFRKEPAFSLLFQDHVDKNTSAMINFLAAQRWLGLRIELLGASIGFALTTTIVCANGTLRIPPGLIGFVIQWAVVFSAALNFFFLRLSESEARITSIERVSETSKLDPEAAWETSPEMKMKLKDSWPDRGELVFDSISMRYRQGLPLSLDNVSFTLQPAMRCGVVGRTGSGKSSLTAALFRLVELEGGRILLDGVDISRIGLSDLRGRPNGLRILPQDPVLYAGTLRDCLDPFHTTSDERILDTLRAVRHRGAHNRGVDLLEDHVEEGGANFSVGERQLLCLARAIVEEPRVLVLDEATASVDTATDAVIQEMLRSRFQNTTLFAVAHRLQTIMDYDMVVVMEQGRCAEFGAPRDLLAKPNGVFTSFVDATGPESAAKLRQIASKQTYSFVE